MQSKSPSQQFPFYHPLPSSDIMSYITKENLVSEAGFKFGPRVEAFLRSQTPKCGEASSGWSSMSASSNARAERDRQQPTVRSPGAFTPFTSHPYGEYPTETQNLSMLYGCPPSKPSLDGISQQSTPTSNSRAGRKPDAEVILHQRRRGLREIDMLHTLW